MMSLFDEEQIMKSFIRSERHDEARETAERMIRKGRISLEEIADYVPSLSFDELKEIEAEVMQLAWSDPFPFMTVIKCKNNFETIYSRKRLTVTICRW